MQIFIRLKFLQKHLHWNRPYYPHLPTADFELLAVGCLEERKQLSAFPYPPTRHPHPPPIQLLHGNEGSRGIRINSIQTYSTSIQHWNKTTVHDTILDHTTKYLHDLMQSCEQNFWVAT